MKTLGGSALIALVEQVEFELRGKVGAHVALFEASDLGLQDLARRVRYIVLMVIEHVAQDDGGAFEPGRAGDGR